MNLRLWMCGAIAAGCLSSVTSGSQDPAKEQLRIALKDNEVKGNWVYDDLPSGMSIARKANKPLMVVFRCVP